MIVFGIAVIVLCFIGLITLCCLLWWCKRQNKPPIKKKSKSKLDMRKTQALNESMIETEKTLVMEDQELNKILQD